MTNSPRNSFMPWQWFGGWIFWENPPPKGSGLIQVGEMKDKGWFIDYFQIMDFSHKEDDVGLLFTEVWIIWNELQLKHEGFR